MANNRDCPFSRLHVRNFYNPGVRILGLLDRIRGTKLVFDKGADVAQLPRGRTQISFQLLLCEAMVHFSRSGKLDLKKFQ